MASFIAKQVVGKKLESVKDALVDKDEKSDRKSDDSEQDPIELEEARKEAEERRKDKYRKLEEEREKLRQDIRDKYGIKKKDNIAASSDYMASDMDQRRPNANGSSCVLTDTAAADDPGFTLPKSFEELTTRVSQFPGKVMAGVESSTDRCCLQ